MKIWVYTLCYNEMKILPWVEKYWKQYADKVIVYDNESDDGSIEFLQQLPYVEIRKQDGNDLDDDRYLRIKNNVWKEAREHNVDFVVVCDIDEVLYAKNNNIRDIFEQMKRDSYTVCCPTWYNLVTRDYPNINDNERYVHQQNGVFANVLKQDGAKTLIFDPNKIEEINYVPGAHKANPTGEVKTSEFPDNGLCTIHLEKMGLEYFLDKMHSRAKRLSFNNLIKGYGIHYKFSDDTIKKNFETALRTSIRVEN